MMCKAHATGGLVCVLLGAVLGVWAGDGYPFPADPTPGGAQCGLNNGCMEKSSYNECARCCETHCPGSNNCLNACWNVFCRNGGGVGCPE